MNKRAAKLVLEQINVFKALGTDSLLAGGYVTAFLDLVDNKEDVVQHLKAVDLRLNMLKTSS